MVLTRQHIPLLVATMVAGLLVGAGVRSCKGAQPEPSKPEVIHDTVTIEKEAIEDNTAVRSVEPYDTAVVLIHDTVQDTIYIEIPIEHKQYRDTINADSARIRLNILFHGYRAGIDHIGVSYDIRPVTRTEIRKKGWGQFVGVGIGAGYGVSAHGGNVYASPQVGINIVYGFGYHF